MFFSTCESDFETMKFYCNSIRKASVSIISKYIHIHDVICLANIQSGKSQTKYYSPISGKQVEFYKNNNIFLIR